MSLTALSGNEAGIASAWIAATMGVKSNRQLKKQIRQVYIPQVCEAVSVLATKENHLRLTSNLLYGLSVIFKHKVTAMESEISEINFRLQSPIFKASNTQEQVQLSKAPQSLSKLSDDSRFNIETDFVPEFTENDTLQDILASNFANSVAVVQDGEEDLSFYPNETNVAVDFEFDFMGNIIEADNAPILDLLNTEEDFVASRPTIDDISKSLNSVSYDQHFTTTLDVVRSKVTNPQASKKRKLKIIIDRVTTFCPTANEGQSRVTKERRFEDIYHQLSQQQPAYLNANREFLYPALSSVQSCFLDDRRRKIPIFRDVEIERGRNLPTHGRGSGLFEAIGQELQLEDLDFNFLMEAGGRQTNNAVEVEAPNSKKLEDFSKYLRERMTEVSGQLPGGTDRGQYSFESLLPSRPGIDVPVSRKVAANSFSFMLQLLSTGDLQVEAGNLEDNLNSPDEVFVSFV